MRLLGLSKSIDTMKKKLMCSDNRNTGKIIDLLSIIALVIQYIVSIIYEWKYYYSLMTSDVAADLLLAKTMADNNEWLVSKNFYYTTEIHLLHTSILQNILFRITTNYKVVFIVSYIIFAAGVIGLVYMIVYKITNRVSWSCLAGILIIGVGGDFWSVGFAQQCYIAYLFFALIACFIYMKILVSRVSRPNVIVIGYMALVFSMSLSGIRYISLIILPIIIYEIVVIIVKNIRTEKIVIDDTVIMRLLATIIPSMLGYGLFISILSELYKPGISDATLVSGKEILENLLYTPVAMIEVFGAFVGVGKGILTRYGIVQCLMVVILVLLWCFIISSWIKNLKRIYNCEIDANNSFVFISVTLLISFVLNVFYLSNTVLGKSWGRVMETHYLALALVLFVPVEVICVEKAKINKTLKWGVVLSILLFVFLVDVCKFQPIPDAKPEYVDILSNNDYKFGWSSDYWYGANIAALTDGDIEVGIHLKEHDYEFYRWGTKKAYEEMSPEFVIIHADEDINVICPDNKANEIYNDDQIIIYSVN